MDERQIEEMLRAYGRERRGASTAGPPTGECLGMPTLERMAEDPEAGSPAQRAHVASCGFCTQMIHAIRAEDTIPEPIVGEPNLMVKRWIAVRRALSAAACLVLGLGFGLMIPRYSVGTIPEGAPTVSGEIESLEGLSDSIRDARRPQRRTSETQETASREREEQIAALSAQLKAIDEENNFLGTLLDTTVERLDEVITQLKADEDQILELKSEFEKIEIENENLRSLLQSETSKGGSSVSR